MIQSEAKQWEEILMNKTCSLPFHLDRKQTIQVAISMAEVLREYQNDSLWTLVISNLKSKIS